MNLRTSFLTLVCAMCFAIFAAPVASSDTRLAEFIRKFDLMDTAQASRAEWLGNKSPFAPYLEGSVVEALGESERALYGKAFNAGACRVMRMLGTVGFLNRYPDLVPAFERVNVLVVFGVHVLPILTQNQQRCIPNNRRTHDNMPLRPEIPSRQKRHG